MTDKNRITRRILLLLFLLLTAVLQNTAGLFLEPFGARAFLLIPAAVVVGMFERSLFGALLGAFAGALWDLTSVHDGFNTVFLFFVAFISGMLISRLMRNGVLTALTLSTAFTAVYIALYVLVFFVFAGAQNSGALLFGFYLPSFLYSVAVSPLQYLFVKAILGAADRRRGLRI